MHISIADTLLIHTGHTITALVSLDENGKILDVRLFDTHWQMESMRVHPDATALWLISHHPEGQGAPYAQDTANAAYFRRMSGLPVQLWIASEYFPGGVIACGESR